MSKLLGSRLIAGRIDDDLIRRLVHAIEDNATAMAEDKGCSFDPVAEAVSWALDGDAFLAYQHVRGLLAECYPDVYGEAA